MKSKNFIKFEISFCMNKEHTKKTENRFKEILKDLLDMDYISAISGKYNISNKEKEIIEIL